MKARRASARQRIDTTMASTNNLVQRLPWPSRRPAGGPGAAVEGQFAYHGVLVEPIGRHLPAADEDAHGDGQVDRGGLLGRSAGARLMTTRFCGRWKPELAIARAIRGCHANVTRTACSVGVSVPEFRLVWRRLTVVAETPTRCCTKGARRNGLAPRVARPKVVGLLTY